MGAEGVESPPIPSLPSPCRDLRDIEKNRDRNDVIAASPNIETAGIGAFLIFNAENLRIVQSDKII